LTSDDKFILMGCDGIWEILNANELCTIVHSRLVSDPKAELVPIVEKLLDKGLAPSVACTHYFSYF